MRKTFLILAFFLLPVLVFAQNVPQPVGWVNDFANVIDKENIAKLNSLIAELEEKTTAEIAVVTISSIAPYDEVEYARKLFDSWKPGKKGKDNGVLVLLAVKERRWRIETGYGVEGILPDGLCGEIGRNYMVPLFKGGDYGKGLYFGVTEISRIISRSNQVSLNNLTAVGTVSFPRPKWLGSFLIPLLINLSLFSIIIFPGYSPVGMISFSIILFCGFFLSRMLPVWVEIELIFSIIVIIVKCKLYKSKSSGSRRYSGSSWGGGFSGGGFGGGGFGGGAGGGF